MMRIIKTLIALLICKTTIFVVFAYHDYFPANFRADFLLGREKYFYGWYAVAFYAHIVSGPCSLLMGLVLMSRRFLRRWPRWHRRMGRTQAINVLFVVMPSGLWMARYAMTGNVAAAAFATLSIATAATVAMGWRRAVQRRFVEHQQWMTRCYALLCSAVVLRLFGGVSELLRLDGVYPVAAWASWILPLLVVEAARFAPFKAVRLPRLTVLESKSGTDRAGQSGS